MNSQEKLISNLEIQNKELLTRLDNRYKETIVLREMLNKTKEQIIEELNNRIVNAENIDNYEAKFALENFFEWYKERFVY
jgi:hypothetical protein